MDQRGQKRDGRGLQQCWHWLWWKSCAHKNGNFFFFKLPFSELLSNDWDCCSTYARPGVALWRHSLNPEKTWAEYRNNRGCYIETGLGLNGAKMIFGWNKCDKKEYSAHHQTSSSSKHQAEPSTQGWTDSCLNVVYAKFWLNHLNAATAAVTH